MKFSITLVLFFSFINFSLLGQPADDAEATTGDITGTARFCYQLLVFLPPTEVLVLHHPIRLQISAAPAVAPQAASMVTAPAPAPAISTAVESNTLVTAVQDWH